MKHFVLLMMLLSTTAAGNTPPEVTHVWAQQRANSNLVDVTYSVTDPDLDALTVNLYLLDYAGAIVMQCASVFGDVGAGVQPGTDKSITWDAGADFPDQYGSDYSLRVVADDGVSSQADGFVLIPAGTFTMGSPSGELGRSSSEVQHQVTLTKAFYMSPFEVTEELWDSVMGSGASTSQLPKAYVSWYDAIGFCNALSVQNGLTPAYTGSGTSWTWNQSANGYRLPSEAEWEYACRAGSVTAFANGPITETGCSLDPNLDAMGWYCYNAGSQTHDVGGKQANAWGLYDLHGNVLEWCWDWYGNYATESVTDPVGPGSGSFRVLRGGGWSSGARSCRSAFRPGSYPDGSGSNGGFRLMRSAL